MHIRCLGPLEATEGGRDVPLGGPKQRLVLAQLLVHANRTVPVDRLIADVWGDDPPRAVRSSLQSFVSHLRKALGAHRIEGGSQGYALRVAGDEVDRIRFEALAARGRTLRTTDPAAAAAALTEALALWRGTPFADLAWAPSLQPEITRLDELRAATVEERVAAELDCGRGPELVAELEAGTAALPLRERRWGLLMTALYRAGRQADALAAYDRARALLADELGIDPSPDLRAVHSRVLRQDPALLRAGPSVHGHRLVERLGSGTFGVTWRATQPGVDRQVAVKVAHPALVGDGGFIRRFEADAQRVARIEHPHVAPLYDFWREPDGAYLVLRWLGGGDLTAWQQRQQPPDRGERVRVAVDVVQALAAAHRQGVVHGAVSSSNIMFDDEGNAYLTDFAIATGGVVADPAASTAAEVDDRTTSDPRADVHALGVVLSELLGTSGGSIGRVLDRATGSDAADQHADAVALLDDLLRAVGPTTMTAGTDPAPAPRNPYKGLRPFGEVDAVDFFGREATVAHLLARLREQGPGARFLAIVGPSGSGKSSVARAGLVPALRGGALPGSGGWFIVQLVPGDRPFDALATALRSVATDAPDDLATRLRTAEHLHAVATRLLPDDGELLVVIDQFEELFTRTDDDSRHAFADALVDAVGAPDSRMRVVITLRADHYDRPLGQRGLADLVRARTEAIVPLGADELERAVTGPAALVGTTVEPALVAQLLADVADQPGALPLLQFALAELFDRRSDAALTADAYHRIGGVAGALGRRAEAVHAALPQEAQEVARQAFLRLVTPGEGTDDTRRRAPVAELRALAPDHMPTVLDAFGDARLLSFGRDPRTREPTVEVAHEALLHEWRRLAGWIDAARDDLRTHRRLHTAAAEWLAADRDPSFLTTGPRLEDYVHWRDGSGLALDAAELDHLDASVAARDAAVTAEAMRRAHEADLERRSVHRLRTLVAVLAVAAVVGGGLTILAVTQARRAAGEAQRAEGQARVATARELAAAAVASLTDDPERGMLLAVHAIEETRDVNGTVLPEAEEALHRAVTSSRMVLRVPDVGGAVDWGAGGETFVTEGPEDTGLVDIRDGSTGASVRSWTGHDIDVNEVMFSPDGALLASTGDDGAAVVWDPATGDEIARTTGGGPGEVWAPSFSADGARLAAASPDGGWVAVLDTRSGRTLATIERDDEPWATALSPDGARVAIASRATAEATVLDVASGDEVVVLGGQGDAQNDVAWSPDGRSIATTGVDGAIRVWDARTGAASYSLFAAGSTRDVDWSADGHRLASAGDDGTATVWQLIEGGARQAVTLTSRDTTNGVRGVALSPDGERLLTGDIDVSAAVVWDVSDDGDAEWTNIASAPQLFSPVAFTPDGRGVVTTGPEGVVQSHDATDGRSLLRITDHRSPATIIESLEVHRADARIAAAVNTDGPAAADDEITHAAAVWSPSGSPVTAIDDDTWVIDVAWHPRRDVVALSNDQGQVRVVDASGSELATLGADPDSLVGALEFSPDGTLLATATFDRNRFEGVVRVWDWRERRVVRTLDVFTQDIAFSPDGARLATAETSGAAHVWDVRTGRQVTAAQRRSGILYAVAFAPDGRTVATAGADRAVHLWDASTGTERLALRGADGEIGSVEFSPDGSRLAAGGEDGLTRVWALDLDDLIAIATGELTRGLSRAECRQYLHLDTCPPP